MSYLTESPATLWASVVAGLEGEGFSFDPFTQTPTEYMAAALEEPGANLTRSPAQMLSELIAAFGGGTHSHLTTPFNQLMEILGTTLAGNGEVGAPEWVPEGALAAGSFSTQQYYCGGAEVAENEFFEAVPSDPYFLPYDPANHTEDGLIFSDPVPPASSYVVQINSEFISGLGSGMTVVIDLFNANAAQDTIGFDIFSIDQTLWMSAMVGLGEVQIYDGSGVIGLIAGIDDGRHRIAVTIISGKIAVSHNGGAVVLHEEPPEFANQFENVGVFINASASGYTNIIYSIDAFPPQDDAALPALSAL